MGKRTAALALLAVAMMSVEVERWWVQAEAPGIVDSSSVDGSWTTWARGLFEPGAKTGRAFEASEIADQTKEGASNNNNIAANVKVAVGDKASEAYKKAGEAANNVYKQATDKSTGRILSEDAVDSAEQAKETLLTAKEKAAQAAADIGDKLKSKVSDL